MYQQLINMKKQTAVEWQFEQLFNSFEKFNNKEYTFDEFLSSNLRIREQAKEMEKEQIQNAYWEGGQDVPMSGKQCDQYYNETYGGNK
jgi:hypothetical protein